MSLIRDAFRSESPSETRFSTIDDYVSLLNDFSYNGNWYTAGNRIQQTLVDGKEPTESVAADFTGIINDAYCANGIVFAVMLARRMVFSSVRFRGQRLNDGAQSAMFGGSWLSIFERPWPGGTTQDLLYRVIDDADLAGNAYVTRMGDELVRLRPDWVSIVAAPRYKDVGFDEYGRIKQGIVGYKRYGYVYQEGGFNSQSEPVSFTPNEVAHFCPNPDPLASFRGMSWLTPIIREIQADKLMTRHKAKFFHNGATPNMIIKHPAGATPASIKRFDEMLQEEHGGVENAYKTLQLYPGADGTVVGSSFEQIDFKRVQGGGETRIAAAGGVPPIIVGLSEGLEAATYSNYGQARRRFADGTMHPLWQNVAGTFEVFIRSNLAADGERLWYDATDVPFLREDEKDAADIRQVEATTIRTLVDGGYTPESVLAAVQSGDWRLLKHTGLFSVQLQKPGNEQPTQPAPPADQPQLQGA